MSVTAVQWFSLVSSTNKTDCHDIIEMLLKVAWNTLTLTQKVHLECSKMHDRICSAEYGEGIMNLWDVKLYIIYCKFWSMIMFCYILASSWFFVIIGWPNCTLYFSIFWSSPFFWRILSSFLVVICSYFCPWIPEKKRKWFLYKLKW